MSKLLLLDISGLVHRSFHSLKVDQFKTSNNQPTNAVFGLIKTLLSLNNEFEDYTFVACCDTKKEHLWRTQLNVNYKKQRPQTNPDLASQFPLVERCLAAANISNIYLQGYEADDIIASISKQNASSDVVIVSADKDMLQLLQYDHVRVYNPNKKIFVSVNDCINKYSVTPEQFTFYQTLVGDSCDNIKGVKGIGPKIAAKIVNEYKTLENFMEQNKKYNVNNIAIDNKLVTLSTDISFQDETFDFLKQNMYSEHFKTFCRELEFTSILKQLSNF